MRLRFWIGLVAVLLIAAGSVVAALIVRADDSADFHAVQRDEAIRAAHQAEAVARLSVGELASAAAFFQAENRFSGHEFDVVAKPLLRAGALSGTAFVQRVPGSERAGFEREHGFPIFEPSPNGPRRARPRAVYYPILYVVSNLGSSSPVGYDLGADPTRAPFLRRARDLGKPVATPPVKLLIGGIGINVYRPVYRDGAPIATVAQRRAALIGFAAGAFRVDDLAAAAVSTVPERGRRAAADQPPHRGRTARGARRRRRRADPHRQPHLAAGRPRSQPARRQPAAAARRRRHRPGRAAGRADPGLEPQRADAGAAARGRPGPADRPEEPPPLRGRPADGDGPRRAARKPPGPC